jgi:hypothetical protein
MVRNTKYYMTPKKASELNDVYLLYINLKNAFGSIDHVRLLTVKYDLGYPLNVVQLVENIYSHSTTIFSREYFGKTPPIHIQRGTI